MAAGGPQAGENWFQIGSRPYATACDSSAVYVLVVVDRQTLDPKVVDANGCYANGTDLSAALKKLGSGDLAVVGSTHLHNVLPTDMDTTAIGGMQLGGSAKVPTADIAAARLHGRPCKFQLSPPTDQRAALGRSADAGLDRQSARQVPLVACF